MCRLMMTLLAPIIGSRPWDGSPIFGRRSVQMKDLDGDQAAQEPGHARDRLGPLGPACPVCSCSPASASDSHDESSQATSAAAFFRSTETSWLTPGSPIVTPKSRSIRAIVTA